MAIEELIGKRFTRLLVLSIERRRSRDGGPLCVCQCDCGNECKSLPGNLRSGRQQSCGCLKRERTVESHWKHGATSDKASKEMRGMYHVWSKMRDRCKATRAKQFKSYGSKGILVCPQWNDFQAFVRDMGMRPSSRHQLDRIENSKGYSPDNCRWVLPKEQQRNRTNNFMVEFRGEMKTLAEWCELFGVGYAMVYIRIKRRGWSIEKALTTPPLRSKESQSRKRKNPVK